MLENIKVTSINKGKSNRCSGDKFEIMLEYEGRDITMIFHDNYKNESDKRDFVYALLTDADAYESCDDLEIFCREFGFDFYEEHRQAEQTYEACKTQSRKLHFLFTDEEIEEIRNELQDY